MYEKALKPLFFLMSAEKAHYFAMGFFSVVIRIPGIEFLLKRYFNQSSSDDVVKVCGLDFPNSVGLAAGFDKDARWLRELAVLGFGHVEIGTLTPVSQPGNPSPRLFRLPKDSALLNRMGFNNAGAEEAIKNLKKNKHKVIIGGNIGKNTDTNPEAYTSDYLAVFRELHPFVDYFVLNVSCPNVASDAKLSDKEYLVSLISECQKENHRFKIKKPILLKIAPDLNNFQLRDIFEKKFLFHDEVPCNLSFCSTFIRISLPVFFKTL